mgnify:CR=1 FL=1
MISLCSDWEFTREWSAGFAHGEGRFPLVDLPHTAGEVPLHYAKPEDYAGICGYRRGLSVPLEYRGKRLFLQFDGAAHFAEVYLNGEKLAEHACGYTAFRVEITSAVRYGLENRLAVRLDTPENPAVPPFGFVLDYLAYGGLYREVWLDVRGADVIEDVFVTTPTLTRAEIALTVSGSGARRRVTLLDAAGAVGGTTVAVAAATFGLIFGSVLGGPIARHLIVKNHLREELPEGREHEEDADDAHFTTHSNRFVLGFLMLAFCVGLGSYVTTGLTKLCGFNFPAYIGPMLVAVLVRNLIDRTGRIEFPAAEIGTMGNMFLAIFLSMALSGLKLWQLVDLALPMLVCLAAEVLLMVFFSILVLFPLMGRNYDAAMITAGFIGFGMGATSNAMANMQAVARRYGPSPSAYFMIPMVGGLFNDFFNAAIIALSIGLLS